MKLTLRYFKILVYKLLCLSPMETSWKRNLKMFVVLDSLDAWIRDIIFHIISWIRHIYFLDTPHHRIVFMFTFLYRTLKFFKLIKANFGKRELFSTILVIRKWFNKKWQKLRMYFCYFRWKTFTPGLFHLR